MSYNTVSECDAYLQSHYLTTDVAYDNWEVLMEDEKQILLNKAFDVIESLPYVGRKTSSKQPTAFPRWPDKEVPAQIKYAECELAITLSDAELAASFAEYRKMIDYGIQSYSVGNFKETLLSYDKKGTPAVQFGLVSDAARRLLIPWMSGGYRIG